MLSTFNRPMEGVVDEVIDDSCNNYKTIISSVENEMNKLLSLKEPSSSKEEKILDSLTPLKGSQNLVQGFRDYCNSNKEDIYSLHIHSASSQNKLSHRPSYFYNDSCSKDMDHVVDSKQEAYVLHRMSFLKKRGLWSASRLPKIKEIDIPATHINFLHDEIVWMAVDFNEESKWKRSAAKQYIDVSENVEVYEKWSNLLNKNENFLYQLSSITPEWLSVSVNHEVEDEDWLPSPNDTYNSPCSSASGSEDAKSDDLTEDDSFSDDTQHSTGSEDMDLLIKESNKEIGQVIKEMHETMIHNAIDEMASKSELIKNLIDDNEKSLEETLPSGYLQSAPINECIQDTKVRRSSRLSVTNHNPKVKVDQLEYEKSPLESMDDDDDESTRDSFHSAIGTPGHIDEEDAEFQEDIKPKADMLDKQNEIDLSSLDYAKLIHQYKFTSMNNVQQKSLKQDSSLAGDKYLLDLMKSNMGQKYILPQSSLCRMSSLPNESLTKCFKWLRCCYTKKLPCLLLCSSEYSLDAEIILLIHLAFLTNVNPEKNQNSIASGNWGPHLILTSRQKIPFWRYLITLICPGFGVRYFLGQDEDPSGSGRRLKKEINACKTHIVVATYKALKEKPHFFWSITNWKTVTLHMSHLFYSQESLKDHSKEHTQEHLQSDRIKLENNPEESHTPSEMIQMPKEDMITEDSTDLRYEWLGQILVKLKILDQRIMIAHKDMPMFCKNKMLFAQFMKLPLKHEIPMYDFIDWFKFRFDDEEEDWDNLVYEEEIQCPLSTLQSIKHDLIIQSKVGDKAIKHGDLLDVLETVNNSLLICNHPILLEKTYKNVVNHLWSLVSNSLHYHSSYQISLNPVWEEEEKLYYSEPLKCLKEIQRMREDRECLFHNTPFNLFDENYIWSNELMNQSFKGDSASSEKSNLKRTRASESPPDSAKAKKRKLDDSQIDKSYFSDLEQDQDYEENNRPFITQKEIKEMNLDISMKKIIVKSDKSFLSENNEPTIISEHASLLTRSGREPFQLTIKSFGEKILSLEDYNIMNQSLTVNPHLYRPSVFAQRSNSPIPEFPSPMPIQQLPTYSINDLEIDSGKLQRLDYILSSLLKSDEKNIRSRIILLIGHRSEWLNLIEAWLRAKFNTGLHKSQSILVLDSHDSINIANQWSRGSRGPLIALMNGRLPWTTMSYLNLCLEDSVIILDTDWRVQVNDALRNKLHCMALCGLSNELSSRIFSSIDGSQLPLLRVYRLYATPSINQSSPSQLPCVETNLVTTGVTRLLPSSVFVIMNKLTKINKESSNNDRCSGYRKLLASRVLPNVVQLFFSNNSSSNTDALSTVSSCAGGQNTENMDTASNNDNDSSIQSVQTSTESQKRRNQSAHIPLAIELLSKGFEIFENSKDQELYSLSIAEQIAQETEVTEDGNVKAFDISHNNKENHFSIQDSLFPSEIQSKLCTNHHQDLIDEFHRYIGFKQSESLDNNHLGKEEYQLFYSLPRDDEAFYNELPVWIPLGFDASRYKQNTQDDNSSFSSSQFVMKRERISDIVFYDNCDLENIISLNSIWDYDPDPMLDSELPRMNRIPTNKGSLVNGSIQSGVKRPLAQSQSVSSNILNIQNPNFKRRKFVNNNLSNQKKSDPNNDEYITPVPPNFIVTGQPINLNLIWCKENGQGVSRNFLVPRASYHKPELSIVPRSERVRRIIGSQGSNMYPGSPNNFQNYPGRFPGGLGPSMNQPQNKFNTALSGPNSNQSSQPSPVSNNSNFYQQQLSFHPNNQQILPTNLPAYIQNQLPRDPTIVYTHCSAISHMINSSLFHRYLLIPFAYKLNVAAASMAMNKQHFNVSSVRYPTSQSQSSQPGNNQMPTVDYPLITSDGVASLVASLQHPYGALSLPGINLGSGPDWTAAEESALFFAITHLQGITLDYLINMPKISRSYLHNGLTINGQNNLSSSCINFRLIEFFLNAYTPVRSYRSSKQCLAALTRICSIISVVNGLSPSNFELANTELNNCLSSCLLTKTISSNSSTNQQGQNLSSASSSGQSAANGNSSQSSAAQSSGSVIATNQTNNSSMTGRKVKNKMKSTYAAIMNSQSNSDMDVILVEGSQTPSVSTVNQSASLNASLLHRFKSLSFFDRLRNSEYKETDASDSCEIEDSKASTSQEAMAIPHIRALANEIINVNKTYCNIFSHVIKDKSIGPGGKQIIGLYDDSLSLLHHQIQNTSGSQTSIQGTNTSNYHYRLTSNVQSSNASGIRRTTPGHATIMTRSIQGPNIVATTNNATIITSNQKINNTSGNSSSSSGPMIAKNPSHIAALQEYSINPDTLITPAMVIKNKEDREVRLKQEVTTQSNSAAQKNLQSSQQSSSTSQPSSINTNNSVVSVGISLMTTQPQVQASSSSINVISSPAPSGMRWISPNQAQPISSQWSASGNVGTIRQYQSTIPVSTPSGNINQSQPQFQLAVNTPSINVMNRLTINNNQINPNLINRSVSNNSETYVTSNTQNLSGSPTVRSVISSNISQPAGQSVHQSTNIIRQQSQIDDAVSIIPQGTTTVIGLPNNYSWRPSSNPGSGSTTQRHQLNQGTAYSIRRNLSATSPSGQIIIGSTNQSDISPGNNSIRLASRQQGSTVVTGTIPMQQYHPSQIYSSTSQTPQILRTKPPIRGQIRPQTYLRTISAGNNSNIIRGSRTVNVAVTSVLTSNDVSLTRPIHPAIMRPMGQMVSTQIITRATSPQTGRPQTSQPSSVTQSTLVPGSQVLLTPGQVQIYSTNSLKSKNTSNPQNNTNN